MDPDPPPPNCLPISMDPDPPPPSTPRKVKFTPKAPPRRTPRLVRAKTGTEVEDDVDNEAMKQFLSRKDEHLARLRTKTENKSPSQVAFSHGAVSTGSIRTFGKQKEKTDGGKGTTSSIKTIDAMQIDERKDHAASSKENLDEYDVQKLDTYMSTDAEIAMKKKTREYREPWDYHHSNYPITLPLRRPYSGNPELLDKAEFEEALECDEKAVSSASDLGLLDQDDDTPRMLFFQLPSKLPLGSSRPSRASKGKEISGSSINRDHGYSSKKDCNLEELPEGYMGKMMVYKSGAVKLKLGNVLYDVSPGSDCVFAQSVMAINAANKQCCELGELNKRAVVTPDIDSLVDNVVDLG